MTNFRPDPKPAPREKPLFKQGLKKGFKKPTGELPLMKTIVIQRGRRSEISGTPIPDPTPRNMMHVLAKGDNQYPRFILYAKNIRIVTYEEHDEWDNGLREDLKKLPEWDWIFELEDELMEEYKNLPAE